MKNIMHVVITLSFKLCFVWRIFLNIYIYIYINNLDQINTDGSNSQLMMASHFPIRFNFSMIPLFVLKNMLRKKKKKNQQVMLTHNRRGNFGIFSRLLYFPIFKISQNWREKILVGSGENI